MKPILAALTVLALPAGVSQAADHHIDIVNKTTLVMTHFYASGSRSSAWGDDILGRATVAAGDTATVDIADPAGSCKFDFKAVFQGGTSLVRNAIDVCQISSFTYNP